MYPFIFTVKEIIMGCWNETCAISHLPIRSGNKAVLIYLTTSPYSNRGRLCEVTDAYVPASLPIYGTYDNYGCLDYDVNSPENGPGVLSVIMLMEDSGYTGTLREFQGDSMQGNVSYALRTNHEVTCQIIPVLILKEVWDYVTDPANIQRDFDPYDLNKVSKDDHVSAGAQQLISMRDYMRGGDPFAMITHRPSWSKPGIGAFMELSSRINLRAGDIMCKWFDHPEIPAESLSRAICDMTAIHTFMAHNRKAWYITAGTGSQDENYAGAIAFYKKMAAIAEGIDQRNQADYEEWNRGIETDGYTDEPG